MKKISFFAFIFCLLMIQGCAALFEKYYTDLTGGIDLTKTNYFIPSSEDPKLIRGRNPDDDAIQMLEDGYALIGTSSFNGPEQEVSGAIRQAKKVNASVVIVYAKYTGTVSNMAPIFLRNSQPIYIPSSVNRSDQFASYWIKIKPQELGLHFKKITSDIAQKIGTNKGILVNAVIKGSPAFDADIIRGDVVNKIDSTVVFDDNSLDVALNGKSGKTVTIDIYRGDKKIQKTVTLRAVN